MQELWLTIRGKAARPSFAHLPTAPATEPNEEWIVVGGPPPLDVSLAPIAGTSCIVEYTNAAGETSQRLVTCQRLDHHPAVTYLWAFCHSREQVRQFRLDRIRAIFDALTGEQHESASAFFAQFEIDRVHASKPGWGLSVRGRADFLAFINALIFLARCDREFHALERTALEDAICSFWLRLEHRGEPDCASIMHYVDRLAPDAETFWVAMHRCARSPQIVRLLKQTARSVIEADGHIAPEEFYWGSKIDEFAQALVSA